MRLLYFFMLFLFIQNGIAQNNFKFDDSNYQTLINRSKAEQKPIFLMLYASWCPHCAKMKSEVLNDTLVTDLLSKNYICAWQDIDSAAGIMLNNKFKITSLPTFIFLDSNEKELYRLKGEFKTPIFIEEIKNALNPIKQLPYLEKEFLSDLSNAEKGLNYLNTLKKGRDRADLSKTAHQYLATQSEKQLISETNWKIIANGVTDISSREFQFVLNHQKEFATVASVARVDRKITNIAMELLKPFTENLDTLNYFKKRTIAKTINSIKVDSLIFSYNIRIAERTGNWSSYRKETLKSTEKIAWNNGTLLKEISKNYLQHVADSASLKQAIKWANHALEVNESYDGNILISRLYLKIKDIKSATEFAQKARIICSALNCNSESAKDLFLELGIK